MGQVRSISNGPTVRQTREHTHKTNVSQRTWSRRSFAPFQLLVLSDHRILIFFFIGVVRHRSAHVTTFTVFLRLFTAKVTDYGAVTVGSTLLLFLLLLLLLLFLFFFACHCPSASLALSLTLLNCPLNMHITGLDWEMLQRARTFSRMICFVVVVVVAVAVVVVVVVFSFSYFGFVFLLAVSKNEKKKQTGRGDRGVRHPTPRSVLLIAFFVCFLFYGRRSWVAFYPFSLSLSLIYHCGHCSDECLRGRTVRRFLTNTVVRLFVTHPTGAVPMMTGNQRPSAAIDGHRRPSDRPSRPAPTPSQPTPTKQTRTRT